MDDGAWVIFELPGSPPPPGARNNPASTRWAAATQTSYFRDGNTLWAKLVVDNSAGANVQIGTPGAGVSTVGTGPGGAFDAGARLDVSRQVEGTAVRAERMRTRRE